MNPISASARPAARMKMSRFGETNAADSAKQPAATIPRLPARPSMLSRRLKAFVSPTSHRIPSAQPRVGLETNSTEMLLCSTTIAAASCAPSFAAG